ncbi:MAG: FAD-binding oxidoreductase [Eubacteriales bacterium]|nr:FAD-binding oxidoreductase [Eubacteriales bacterium]
MSIKEELINMVGDGRVIDDPKELAGYGGKRNFDFHVDPCFIVKPQNAEQVKQVVDLANKTKTPLVPVSSGGPHIKGGSAPSVPEAVMVDLTGMKQILNINRQQRMAVVEPGVTYTQLEKALEAEGLEINFPLKPRANKSVVTSVLETEPRMNPMHQWNYMDPLRCVEVTWGDGNRMYTGEAAGGPMDLEKQWESEKWQVSGLGPWMFDFYRALTGAQGSMGIVTWAALKCQTKKQIHRMYFVKDDSLQKVIEFVYKAMRFRFPDELFILNRMQLASLLGKNEAEIDSWKAILPKWTALVGVSGRELQPEKRVAVRTKDLADFAQSCGLELLEGISKLGEDMIKQEIKTPSDCYWKDTYKGASQDIFFQTTLDRTECFIKRMYELANELGYPVNDIGVYIQPQHIGSSYHCEFTLPYDPNSTRERELVKNLYEKASVEMLKLDAYYSRPYELWARLQLNKDAQSYAALKKIKNIFDPNGIMNPGKISL